MRRSLAVLLVQLTGCALALGLSDYDGGSVSSSGGSDVGGTDAGATDAVGGGAGAAGGGEGGGPLADCWGTSIDAWTKQPLDVMLFQTTNPAEFVLSPDRLSVHFLAGPQTDRQVYRSTRPSVHDPFSAAVVVTAWNQADLLSKFDIVRDEEIFITLNPGGSADVAGSVYGSNWPQPALIPAPVTSPGSDTVGSVTEDRLVMMLSRDSGDPSLYNNIPALQIHEFQRPSAAAPWVETTVQLPNVNATDWALCPQLNGDGLRMFFGSSHEAVLANTLPSNALSIFYVERATVAGAWSVPERIESLDGNTFQACPVAISNDGCELWLQYFMLGENGAEWSVALRDR